MAGEDHSTCSAVSYRINAVNMYPGQVVGWCERMARPTPTPREDLTGTRFAEKVNRSFLFRREAGIDFKFGKLRSPTTSRRF